MKYVKGKISGDEMKKRSTEILQKIVKDYENKYSIQKLAKDYHVTQRTLRNDIVEINDFLKEQGMSQIFADKDGRLEFGPDFDRQMVEQKLQEMDIYSYKMSSEERRIYLLITLLQTHGYSSMQKIAEELFVSRVTILSDVDSIKEYLQKFHISLITDTGKGMTLVCDKEEKIELLIELFRKIAIDIRNDGFFQRLVLHKMEIQYTFSEIFTWLEEYTNLNNIVFIDDVFYDIVLYLFAEFNLESEDLQDKEITGETKLSGMDYMMLYVGYMTDHKVTEHMISRFRKYLELNHLTSFVKTIDEIELYKVITHFLSEIDKEMGLSLTTDSLLIDSLLLHIKRMKDWGNYQVELPKDAKYAIDYEQLEKMIEKYAFILERFLSYELSENMKKSIVIHICVSLIRTRSYAERLSVAVVCPGSMATGKYLEAQIKNYFDFKIIGVIAASEVCQKLKEVKNVDFIVSTVPIKTQEYKVLVVRPFLTMEDMNMIQKTAFECQKRRNIPQTTGHKQMLMNRMKTIMEDQGLSETLREKIENLILEYENSKKVKSAIGELLRENFVIKLKQEVDWKIGMHMAAKPLEEAGYIGPEYIETSIEHVEEYGDYIIVGEGIALAHAGKENGVYKDGLSLLLSKDGIIFSDGETKVHLLFCFSSIGEKEYVELLREIVAIGKNKEAMEALLEMSEKEVYEKLSSQ